MTLRPVVSDDVAVTRVELRVNRMWKAAATTAPWTLTRRSVDSDTLVKRWVAVDNTRPGVGYATAPSTGSRLRGTARITASTWEGWGLNRVEMLVNGKVVAVDRTSGYSFTLDPKRYGRTFTVQLRAYDLAGNVGYSSKRTYRR